MLCGSKAPNASSGISRGWACIWGVEWGEGIDRSIGGQGRGDEEDGETGEFWFNVPKRQCQCANANNANNANVECYQAQTGLVRLVFRLGLGLEHEQK